MYPYPDVFPSEEVRLLLPVLRGQSPTAAVTSHCCWTVVGYGLHQFENSPIAMDVRSLVSPNLAADYLEAAVDPTKPHPAVAIPWNILLPVLLELLRNWAGQK